MSRSGVSAAGRSQAVGDGYGAERGKAGRGSPPGGRADACGTGGGVAPDGSVAGPDVLGGRAVPVAGVRAGGQPAGAVRGAGARTGGQPSGAVRAAGARPGGARAGAGVLVVGDLVMDEVRRQVWRGGEAIRLTRREFDLLRFLMRNPRRVLSKTQILDRVWDHGLGRGPGNRHNLVELYISYLRRKIDAGRERMIHTRRGAGYVLKPAGPGGAGVGSPAYPFSGAKADEVADTD